MIQLYFFNRYQLYSILFIHYENIEYVGRLTSIKKTIELNRFELRQYVLRFRLEWNNYIINRSDRSFIVPGQTLHFPFKFKIYPVTEKFLIRGWTSAQLISWQWKCSLRLTMLGFWHRLPYGSGRVGGGSLGLSYICACILYGFSVFSLIINGIHPISWYNFIWIYMNFLIYFCLFGDYIFQFQSAFAVSILIIWNISGRS